MYRCGVLVHVLTLCAATWGTEQSAPLAPTVAAPTGVPIKMMDYCFFGQFPSATCRFKCHLKDMESYCDQEQKLCLCTESEKESEEDKDSQEVLSPVPQHPDTLAPAKPPVHLSITPVPATETPTTPESDKQHHVVFYIFDLGKIFKKNQTDASTEAPESTEAGAEAEVEGWSLQHMLALVIVILLLFLVGLEVYNCYKRQRGSSSNMETIFKMPPPNDKA